MANDHRRFTLRITLVVTLGGLLFGYDTGVIGGTQLYFTEYFSFSKAEQGWAISSALIGCLCGAAIAGYLSSRFSRKYSLMVSAVLFTISAWGSGIPESLQTLALYRWIGGVGLGIASMVAPIYIAEIAPSDKRGRLVSLYQLAIVTGFFLVFTATYLIGGGDTQGYSATQAAEIHKYNVKHGWRIMFWSELIPSIAFLVLLYFVPHTPRWLMMNNRKSDAMDVLGRMTANLNEAKMLLLDISRSLQAEARHEGSSIIKALLGPRLRRVLFIGICLSMFQQITGINAILYYGAEIFSNTLGYGPEDALKQQLLLGTVNLIFTFVAIYSVDWLGRKPLLIIGLISMAVGIGTLGVSIYLGSLGTIALLGMLGFIAAFALSMGPVTWVLLSEIFPNRVRSAAVSIAVAAQWLFNAIVAQTFPMVNGSAVNLSVFNGALPYLLFAILSLLTMVFVLWQVPETRGHSLEEMEKLWHDRFN